MKIIKKAALIFLLLAGSLQGHTQIEAANAIDVGYPLLINKSNSKINYGQVSTGLRMGLSYKSGDVHFFPTLYFSFGFMRLPVQQFSDNVAALNMSYLNVLINQNIVFNIGERGNQIYAIGGFGFSKLNPKGLYIAGNNGDAEKIHQDSVKNPGKYFPALEIGIEYVYGGAVNSNVYISMGLNLEYIYLLPEMNDYYATARNTIGNDISIHGSLTGNAFVPSFSLCLHYLMGKNLIFWRKKNSFYL